MVLRGRVTGLSVACLLVCAAGCTGVDTNPAGEGNAVDPATSSGARGAELELGAPINVRAAAGDAFAEVRWDAGPGSTGATVIASPDDATMAVAGPATSARITGLVNGTSYTFTVRSDTGSLSRPSRPVTPSRQANVIADVGFHPQERPLSCESAALRMALEHQGIVRSEATILRDLGVDPRAARVDASGTLFWGNPYRSFVGDPDGSEGALTGYGTYYPTIARVARRHGATILRAGENLAPATLYAAILAGHPAVAWVAYDWTYHPPLMPWVAFDGTRLWWHGPIEHAVSLVGVTPTSVLVNNPSLSTDWQQLPKRAFESGYATFGNMAIILQ